MRRAEALLERIRIPSQPGIIAELNRLVAEPPPDFTAVVELIRRDAAITARLLKLINSPLFSRGREIDSISQALSLLGMENFFKLILTCCLREAVPTSPQLAERFWRHTLRVAVAADHIALQLGSELRMEGITPDQCYITGLFHDCAVPILCANFPPYGALFEVVTSNRRQVLHDEDRTIGTDHCVIGHLMAKSWSLPDHVCRAVLFHHEERIDNDKLRMPTKLLGVVQLADYLAHHYESLAGESTLVIGTETDSDGWCDDHGSVLVALGIEADDVRHLKSDLSDRYAVEA